MDETIISLWDFFIWVIISIGLFLALSVFYSYVFDIRDKESEVLSNKISQCIQEKLSDIESFDLFSDCSLSKKILNKSEKFYVKIVFANKDNLEEIKKEIVVGDVSFQMWCDLQNGKKQRKLPQCEEKQIFVSNYLIKIITASNQNEM